MHHTGEHPVLLVVSLSEQPAEEGKLALGGHQPLAHPIVDHAGHEVEVPVPDHHPKRVGEIDVFDRAAGEARLGQTVDEEGGEILTRILFFGPREVAREAHLGACVGCGHDARHDTPRWVAGGLEPHVRCDGR